jgi:Ras-related protein Rab-11A
MIFEDDYDMIFKTVLIGDSGVGKTNILSRYTRDEFSIETKSTVGVEFGNKRIRIKNTNIKAQIWDTAGQERYKSITNAYYKGAKGSLVVFDITNRDTFIAADRWIGELKSNADSQVTIILIGNKSDLEELRKVSTEEAQAKAEQYGLAYIETSAFQATNIEKAFNKMIEGKIYIYLDIYKKFCKNYQEGSNKDEVLNGQNLVSLEPVDNKVDKQKKMKECCK